MPDAPRETKEQPTAIRGSDLTAILIAVLVFLVILGSGFLNICAATGLWNPFHWKGRLWTGVFMIAAPTVLGITASLPAKLRVRLPDALITWVVLLVWIAFFWAACGGH